MPPPRDLMAPDTEPTDEELATDMRAVRETVLARRTVRAERMRAELEKALAETRERAQTTR
jgi:hypothetical protein